ncbi:hypothetical protein SCHPADRAFT_834775 [Schizopora paradoxa]|uniref:Transposase domain-containing protein n=1 Tax=Schizopora paradoxa TaxID=27342 RepID=A0A0H2RBQ6_9AGAM|nr:hypothetical protein SCHPADRAFT_834775 [Schizopora paradoxa]
MAPVEKLICAIAVWLYVTAGASRSVSNKLLRALSYLTATIFTVLGVALTSLGIAIEFPTINVPRDVRTAYKRHFSEPKIKRTMCCPKCFHIFDCPVNQIPLKCRFRKSPQSFECGASLWRTQRTRKGKKKVPACLYTTQSFKAWLRFFLSRKVIDDALQKTFDKQVNAPVGIGSQMNDVHDSPAWRDLYGNSQSPYNLVFGIYIDWFLIFKMKIAVGKKASCGVISLYCLNLPPHLRYRPENLFIMGITPAPTAPDHFTLDHLLKPVLDEVALFGDALGVAIPTFLHPEEVFVRARIAPVLADSPARSLISGFLGHAAKYFCAFCKCTADQMGSLDLGDFEPRNGTEVKADALKWKMTVTKNRKETLEGKNGIRWTYLHTLDYWDPVKHVVLGFMHNWLEGILEHHLRVLWGVGRGTAHQKKADEMDEEGVWVEEDRLESESELSELAAEEYTYQASVASPSSFVSAASLPPSTNISRTPSLNSEASGPSDSGLAQAGAVPQELAASSTSTLRTGLGREGSAASNSTLRDEQESDDEQYIAVPEAARGVYSLPNDKLLQIRECIRDVTLPTWIGRPPANLGEASHGKLKANDFWVLFSCILPLVVPEFWRADSPFESDRLQIEGFHNLVAATNIICSFKTSNAEADAYTELYVRYREIIHHLFPYWPSRPNQHWAMHNGDFLKYWGPLPPLSEFSGEHIIGMMQNIKTNRKLRDMDYTMLHQMSRRQHVEAALQEENALKPLGDILFEDARPSPGACSKKMSGFEQAQYLANGTTALHSRDYYTLLGYLQATGRPYYSIEDQVLIRKDTRILPPYVRQCTSAIISERTYSTRTSHEGNSAILYYDQFTQRFFTGNIEAIWSLPLDASVHTFFVVRAHEGLPDGEAAKAPFDGFDRHYCTRIVDAAPSNQIHILEEQYIKSHLSTYKRPYGTYGIARETLVVCWALNRDRR